MNLLFGNSDIKNNRTVPFISVFLILFLSSGFLIIQDILSSTLTISLWLLTLIIIVFPRFHMNISHLLFLIIILFLIWFSALINHEDFLNYAKISFGIICTYLFVEKYNFSIFKKTFVDVMVFVSVVSLVFYAIVILIPSVRDVVFITNGKTNRMSNFVFYTIDKQEFYRNFGMFWEPGAFQTFLGIALLLEISKRNLSIKKMVVLLITMITTMSTTAFLSIALLLFFILFNKRVNNNKFKFAIVFSGMISIFLFATFENLLFSGANSTFGKIVYFFVNNAEVSNHTSSVRYWAIIKASEAFARSPLVGMGYNGLNEFAYEYTFGMNTCTFLNWFAVYGLFYGMIISFSTIAFMSKLFKKPFLLLFSTVILLLLIISENYVNNATYFFIVFYGGFHLFNHSFGTKKYENSRVEFVK